MELVPLSVRFFTPARLDRAAAPALLSEEEALSVKKTIRTYWLRIVFGGQIHEVECKKELNTASHLADRIRKIFGRDPIWILCKIRVANALGPQEMDVYIKREEEFVPVLSNIYELEPKLVVEGSGKNRFSPRYLRRLWSIFVEYRRPPEEDPRCIEPVSIEADRVSAHPFSFIPWSDREFVINTWKKLGEGSSKVASYALRIEVINPYHLIVSKRALLRPQVGAYNRVNFELAHLKGLFHPNLGIEKEKNLRYQIINICPYRKVRVWYKLTYLGRDLFQVASKISSEKTLYHAMVEMVSGVKYLHDNNHIHGDLKLSNWIRYTDDRGRSIIKLEDCDCVHKIDMIIRSIVPTQTVRYLSLNLRKVVLNRMSLISTLKELTNESYCELWEQIEYGAKETLEAERNSLGLCLAELYFTFRNRYCTTTLENRDNLEAIIESLTRFPLRKEGLRYSSFSYYLEDLDLYLHSPSKTLEDIEREVKRCSSLDVVLSALLSLYSKVSI
jgi:hypothetical protein